MENHRSENLVEISQLRKSYGSLEVLKGIDLSIKKCEVVSISEKVVLAKVLCFVASTVWRNFSLGASRSGTR